MHIATYEDITCNIKRIIDEKGMKQGVVAERAGFTPQEFSNIMNERRKLLRIEHLCPIACAMGVDVNALCRVEKRGGNDGRDLCDADCQGKENLCPGARKAEGAGKAGVN